MITIRHNKFIINNIYIKISGSKSLSNRLLILSKIFNNIKIKNLSNSDDTYLLKNILYKNKKYINIKNSGTVLRFLITYLSLKNINNIILYGKLRMYKRPIHKLIKALKNIGSIIYYLKNNKYPPLKIKNFYFKKKKIYIDTNISSQYISSLLLSGFILNKKIKIILKKKIVSLPYIKMTYLLLKYLKFPIYKKKNYFLLYPYFKKKNILYYIESDWSSISYYYLISLFFKKFNIKLGYFYKNSIQGDSIVYKIFYKFFNIKTFFKKKYIYIYNNYKKKYININNIYLNLNKYPDLAPTIIVALSLLKKNFYIEGLETLYIKECNRLLALKNELKKIGIILFINKNSIKFIKKKNIINHKDKVIIKTYKDHRIVMSLLPIMFLYKNFYIKNYNVVKKSYPFFWKDLKKCGFFFKKYEKKKKKIY